jgi:hypothetical protein
MYITEDNDFTDFVTQMKEWHEPKNVSLCYIHLQLCLYIVSLKLFNCL